MKVVQNYYCNLKKKDCCILLLTSTFFKNCFCCYTTFFSRCGLGIQSIDQSITDQGGRLYDSGVISLSNSTSDTVIYHLHSTSFPDVQQVHRLL